MESNTEEPFRITRRTDGEANSGEQLVSPDQSMSMRTICSSHSNAEEEGASDECHSKYCSHDQFPLPRNRTVGKYYATPAFVEFSVEPCQSINQLLSLQTVSYRGKLGVKQQLTSLRPESYTARISDTCDSIAGSVSLSSFNDSSDSSSCLAIYGTWCPNALFARMLCCCDR